MKTIWITGGSSGIGFSTAEKFLNENWRVVISSTNLENLIEAKRLLKLKTKKNEIHFLKCDISNRAEVKSTVEKITNKKLRPPATIIPIIIFP